MATTARRPAAGPSLRHLSVVRPDGRVPSREAALRQVRSVRRHLQSREERFAHLKRVYD